MMKMLNMFSCLLNSENISTRFDSVSGACASTSMPSVVNHYAMRRNDEDDAAKEVQGVSHGLEVLVVVYT